MNVLVLNCGSSSVKFQLVETSLEQMKTREEPVLAKGGVSKIGSIAAQVDYSPAGKETIKETREILDHQTAIGDIVNLLVDPEVGVVPDKSHIHAAGHRIVHGGEHFSESVLFDEEVAGLIRECNVLAPLHNPHNLKGYQMAHMALPDIPHAAVFDTAFHQTMEPHVFLYGLPTILYQRHKIRRYGFHGTSHRYVYGRLTELTGKRPEDGLRAITTHLGNGSSMAAIHDGRSVDTTMGFTPLEGLLMGTRTGDLDPAVVIHLMAAEEIGVAEVNTLMNKHSGLLGVSGVSNDMREIQAEAANGNKHAQDAIDMFCYRVKKYIGAYAASLGRLDAIVFTAGIGENGVEVREQICADMSGLGIQLDEARNTEGSGERLVSSDDSQVEIWVIPTNEEIVIARDTVQCVEAAKG